MKFLLITIILLSSFAALATDIKHVRVIWHENPLKKTYIAWHTKNEFKSEGSWFHYGFKKRDGNISQYPIKLKALKKIRLPFTSEHFYFIALENLPPDTSVYFTITSGSDASSEYNFKLPPQDVAVPFKLIFGGDSRSNINMRKHMNRLLAQKLEEDPEILALVHGGDYIYNGSKWKQWLQWLDDNELIKTKSGRILPIIPTRGNHEVSAHLFNRIWMKPGGKGRKNYFTTTLADLSIITLNTQSSCAGKQKRWLTNQLASPTKFMIANYHQPAWPAVKQPSCAKKHWVPFFEEAQLDVVFESDGHTLKRTVPIYMNKQNNEKGIIYLGEGGLGVDQRKPKLANSWYFKSPGYAKSQHHIFILEKTTQLKVKVLSDTNVILDSFTLRQRR